MNITHARRLFFLTTLATSLLFVSVSSALAFPASAPLMRHGHRVGTASANISQAPNGFAVLDAKVTGFAAPSARKSWNVRVVRVSGCADKGFDPSEGNAADFHFVSMNMATDWYSNFLTGRKGTLYAWDLVKECPAGQVPAGSDLVRLQVKNAAKTQFVGVATLFAAG